ncbi:hypothetical protein JW960_04525 [candidate division KSB1 bacterium]|nr:hypothetical protein [candidate division KSB1 bacterium]
MEKYRVDIDYFKVNVVNIDSIGPDSGVQVPYHPPIPAITSFSQHIGVSDDCIVDAAYPDMNFNGWCATENGKYKKLLILDASKTIILHWDLQQFSKAQVNGSGLLELTTHTNQRMCPKRKDFGLVRVVEIMGGDPN